LTASIKDDHLVSGILKLQVEYSTGNVKWHPLDLVKDVDTQAVAQYVLKNDLGPIFNGKHHRWAHAFLRSFKRRLRRLRCCNITGFETSTYHPSPKKRRSRWANKADQTAE